MSLRELFGVELPVIQAPMAGVQGSELAIAVSGAGGLGSLPCALWSPDTMRTELTAMRARTDKPYNVNFFCHSPPSADANREAAWRPRCRWVQPVPNSAPPICFAPRPKPATCTVRR